MQLYSAKVRLGGSLYNEVAMSNLTVPEIMLLRLIHGGRPDAKDAVTEIKALGKEAFDDVISDDPDVKPDKKVLRTDRAERKRLEARYDPKGAKLAKLFGPVGALPQVLEDETLGLADDQRPVSRKRAAPAEPEPATVDV